MWRFLESETKSFRCEKMKIIICGIGGQGVVLLSEIIAQAFFDMGKDIKKTDMIGMAQRGGSVISHIRTGVSPLSKIGDVDCMIALEEIEAFNNLFWKPKVTLLNKFNYTANVTGNVENIRFKEEKCNGEKMVCIDATYQAIKFGGQKYTNIVMLKKFIEFFGLEKKIFRKAMKKLIKRNLKENLKIMK